MGGKQYGLEPYIGGYEASFEPENENIYLKMIVSLLTMLERYTII